MRNARLELQTKRERSTHGVTAYT